jgi:hypothetical protein
MIAVHLAVEIVVCGIVGLGLGALIHAAKTSV